MRFTSCGKPSGGLSGSSKGKGGKVTSHPGELDAILQKAWRPIYQGNAHDHATLAAKFLAAYKEFLFPGGGRATAAAHGAAAPE